MQLIFTQNWSTLLAVKFFAIIHFLQFLFCQELLSTFGALHCQSFTFTLFNVYVIVSVVLLIFLCPVTNCLVWLISLDSCNKRGVWAKCSFCLIVKTQGARRRGSSQTIGSKLNVQTFNSPIFHVMSPPTVSLCTLRSWHLGFTSYYSFKVFHSRNDLFCLFTARLHRPLCAIGDRGKI